MTKRHTTGLCTGYLFLVFAFTLYAVPAIASTDPASPGEPRPNVLLLTIDSLRPDHLGCYGYEKPTSPWIDRISREGVLFRNAIAQGGWTSPPMVSVFTGLYPSTHGVEGRTDAFPCVAQAPLTCWQEAGYRIPASPGLYGEANYSGLGFQSDPGYDNTLEKLFAWVRKHGSQPFFSWFHMGKTVHLPYNPDEAYLDLFLPEGGLGLTPEQEERLDVVRTRVIIPTGSVAFEENDRPGILALYNGEIRTADDMVGRIYTFLEEQGILDNTVIILTADHGEELLERGSIGHASTNWTGNVYEETLHVPLIIRYPRALTPGTVIGPVVETLDILPTLHEMFGIPCWLPFQGKSLLPLLSGDDSGWPGTAFSENTLCGYQCARVPEKAPVRLHAVRSGPWKLIATHRPEHTHFALHNLESDPGEKKNVLDAHPAVALRLKGMLSHHDYRNRILRKQLLENCAAASEAP